MSLESRFWSKVRKLGPDDCWPWLAATNEHGYGVMRPEGRRIGPTVKAHRVSALLDGRDPAGRVVLHSCDNPPCVNPAHLVVCDQADNVRDMHAKGRGNAGSKNGMARATEDMVVEARARVAAGERQTDVAGDLGVSKSTLNGWIKRTGWRHVA